MPAAGGFSEISKNWAGVPLRDYATILNHIRTTTTDTGLSVVAPPSGARRSQRMTFGATGLAAGPK